MKTLISTTIDNNQEYAKVSQYCGFPVYLWSPNNETYFKAFDKFKPELVIVDVEDLNREFVDMMKGFPNLRIVLRTRNLSQSSKDAGYPVQSDEKVNLLQVLRGYFSERIVLYTENCYDCIKESHQFWTKFNIEITSIEPAVDIFNYNPNVEPVSSEYGDIDLLIINDATRDVNTSKIVHDLSDSKINTRVFSVNPGYEWQLSNYCGLSEKELEPSIMKRAKLVLGFHKTPYRVNDEILKAVAVKTLPVTDNLLPINKMFHGGKKIPQTTGKVSEIKKLLKLTSKERDKIIDDNYKQLLTSNTYFDRLHRMYYLLELKKETFHIVQQKTKATNDLQ